MNAPADPVLASSIWLASRQNDGHDVAQPPRKRQRVATGNHALDLVLQGGLEHGQVHGITVLPDGPSAEIVQATIATHLCTEPDATATMIDSTMSTVLDLPRLLRHIESIQQAQKSSAQCTAMQVLDRLKIIRVFDVIGLTQAVAEVRESMDAGLSGNKLDVAPQEQHLRGTVPDSQSDGEGDEMLMSSLPEPVQPPQPYAKAATTTTTTTTATTRGLLLIDNISRVAMPLLKNDYANGQALLSSLMRSLTHVTVAYDLCTVIVGDGRSREGSNESPSLFGSCSIRPALGNEFGYLLDVHILLHMLPRTSGQTREQHARRDAGKVHVMEIVQDRYGGRYGRWAPFEVDVDGALKNVS